MDYKKLWKILKEMEILDHPYLSAEETFMWVQEATVRIGYGQMDCFSSVQHNPFI